jgi:hypothetical protein
MDHFKNTEDSHAHSRAVLDMLYEYDSFMDSLEVVADMGAGSGADANWWATLYTRDDPPEPHNYVVYAVDEDIGQIDPEYLKNENLVPIQGDFETRVVPRKVDLLWSHDSFQYAMNPLETLKVWNQTMNVNGMLVMILPQHQNYRYNRMVTRSYSGSYHHYNVCNLIYMLAVNGFDTRDCFFYKTLNDQWLHLAVYKSDIEPMNPKTTTWWDLADLGLLSDSVCDSLSRHGHVRQEDIIVRWFDKDFYFIRD